jgi:hypothetical protein
VKLQHLALHHRHHLWVPCSIDQIRENIKKTRGASTLLY